MKSMTTAMIKQLLTNWNFIFFLSIISGLLFNRPAEWLSFRKRRKGGEF
jgi:hypothetical protein